MGTEYVNTTEDGRIASLPFAGALHTDPSPMRSYNHSFAPKRDRQAPTCDVDLLPHQYRRYVEASGALQVQLINGLQNGIASGRRILYAGAGYLFAVVPRIPGQTRDNVAGFHPRGPSPLNWETFWQNGPGAQPPNPGGPGQVAGNVLINPMSG